MADLKALYDRSGKPRYLAYKDIAPLIPLTASLVPKANGIDRFLLRIQRPLKGAEIGVMPSFPLHTLQQVMTATGKAAISGALFHDTSGYRETRYTGLVKTDKISAVKIFAAADDVIFAAHQARFVQEHLSGPFVTIPVLQQLDTVLVSPFVRHKRAIEKSDYVEEKLLHLSDIFARNTGIRKDVHDMVPIDFHALCANAGYVDLSVMVRQWLAICSGEQVPVVPVHGDLTPRHVFINHDDKIVLTDYERAGWHVPYYDYYHYVLQPLAARRHAPSIRSIRFATSHPQAARFLVLYLVDQLYQDISAHVFRKHDYTSLHHQIRNRIGWLKTLLEKQATTR